LSEIRVALVGGSEALRSAKRVALSSMPNTKVIFDSDGFGLLPQDFLNVNFDVAIVEQRLGSQGAFEFIKISHSLANINNDELGRFLVAAQFNENQLRLLAIEAGAVDCVFVSDGIESLVEKVSLCALADPDFAIRELLPELGALTISQEGFQNASVALDTLDKKDTLVLKSFCQLKSIPDIAVAASVSQSKVVATLNKIQKLLMLDTRSQLLLRMYRLGALAL
jgi:DNA-binding NarL/FixJ family response regulator